MWQPTKTYATKVNDLFFNCFFLVINLVKIQLSIFTNIIVSDDNVRGVSDLWSNVNHVALVVSDVGTSLSFYTDVVGFQQVMRPNFDR